MSRNYWVRSGTYVFLQRMSTFIFGFGSYFFLVRYLPKDTFGVWALFLVITSIVEMSRSAFIQNAFIKFYSQPDVHKDSLVVASTFLNLISILVMIAIMIGLIPVLTNFWHTTDIGYLILWYCITSLILVPFTQINYIEQASNSFSGIFWSAVARNGTFFVIVVIVFFFFPGMSLNFFAGMQTACALLGLIVVLIGSGKYLPTTYKMDWFLLRRLFGFGKYILGTGVTSSVGKSTDQVLLGSLSHSTEALYNSAIRIMNFIEIPTYSISNVVYPKIAEKVNLEGKHAAAEMYERSVGYILAIILPLIVGVALLPEIVLLLTAGKNYIEASSVLRIIILSAIIFPFNVQSGTAFEVIGKPHISFSINFFSNMLNLALNLALIYAFGIQGAAWTMLLTAVAAFATNQFFLKRELDISVFRVFAGIPSAYRVVIKEVLVRLKLSKKAE